MSAFSSSQTPRSSFSSRPSPTSSLTPASKYSNIWPETGESSSTTSQRSTTAYRNLHDGKIKADQEQHDNEALSTSPLQEQEIVNRRQRPRNSGGFLLDPPFPQGAPLDHASYVDRPREIDTKGKRKVGDGRSASDKRRLIPRRWYDRSNRATSPLAIQVTAPMEGARSDRGHQATGDTVIPANNWDGSQDSRTEENFAPGPHHGTRVSPPPSQSRPAVGSHLDPAQLVQMALSLSESRRRNVSLGRVGLTPAIVDNRRIVSAEAATSGSTMRNSLYSNRSLRQATARNAHDSSTRHISHSPENRRSARRTSPPSESQGPYSPDGLPKIEPTLSTATLARAEKARAHIELSCEYRRLLQFLPPLKPDATHPGNYKVSSSNAPGGHTDIWRTSSYQDKHHDLGRPYNPLQYLRNRRVRISKSKGLDGNTAGWSNVSKVKSWVDAVEQKAAAQTVFRLEDHVMLPEFDEDQTVNPRYKHAPEKVRLHSVDRETMLAEDWEVSPSDLLADAYWLEQDDNKLLVEDRNGRKLFRQHRSRARGRQDKRHDGGAESTRSSYDGDPRRSLSASTVASVEEGDRDDGQGRRKRDILRAPLDKATRLAKKRRRHRSKGHSRSSSFSYTSDDGSYREGKYRQQQLAAQAENVGPFEKRMYEKLKAKSPDVSSPTQLNGGLSSPEPNIGKSVDGSLPNGSAHAKFPSFSSERTDGTMNTENSAPSRNGSQERSTRVRGPNEGKGSLSSSLIVNGLPSNVPSAHARRHSPGSKRSSVLARFRPNRSKERNRIAENDFALAKEKIADSKDSNSSMPNSRGQSFESARDISPQRIRRHRTNDSITSIVSRSGSKTREDERNLQPVTSVSRIFKGGRLGDIVRSESAKLGDYIWRKDSVGTASFSSPDSRRGSEASGNEKVSPESLTMKPTDQLTRMATETRRRNKLVRTTTDKYKARYSEKLPKFKSISAPQGDSSGSSPEQDHISRQQQEQKEKSRPWRFNRLPKIDVNRRASLSSPDLTHTLTNTTEGTYEWRENGLGRLDSSPSRSNSEVRSSARRLHSALEVPSSANGPRSRKRSTFGLSSGISPSARSPARPPFDGKRHWSISDRARPQQSPKRAAVTKRDVAYVRALLLSSGIKAQEIARRAEEPEHSIPPFLLQASETTHTPLNRTTRSTQYSVAAHMLSTDLDITLSSFRQSISHFRAPTCTTFHQQLMDLRDKCDNNLMPLARQCADDADSLMAELNTTHTLGVKQVHDAVDALMRLRRRRLRWLRRIGWVLLEWLLLGVMWIVWAVVVVVKMVKGVFGVGFGAVRWFLWL